MNKRDLSEADIRTKFITPAIVGPGGSKWDPMTQMLEEFHYFTNGRITVRGKTAQRGPRKRVDYILYYKPNLPLAIVEAKDATHAVGAGMQQALAYAEHLDVPFVYSSNGEAFLEHDRTGMSNPVTREIPLDAFPSPEELWSRYCASKGLNPKQQSLSTAPYYDDGSNKAPRYYQRIAINRTVDAISKGQDRILLVMATGTGKTYTAFQIIWRLWKSGAKKRILFLCDRNILADQTKTNDFKPFGKAMTKISNRSVDKSFEIYLALYQAVSGTDDADNIYKQFSPDFFDLIVIDECHRGSAADDAAWRRILEYFSGATQIGLTATPKETKDVSNIEYFGEPIYTYSLKQGIDDGFLAPYKVVRITFDRDAEGWRPESGKVDKHGHLIEDREYGETDFDKTLVLEERTKLVAAKVTEFLKSTDRFAKTIVFCQDIDHAERMRQALVNANADLAAADPRYIVRITGDNDEGKAQLDHFIDPQSRYPVIATTSQLMSTGVDAQTCKLIVLDKRIASMTEFKQIIGRGTRIQEDYGKLFFTILDFRRATALFADPDFDGDPVQIYEPTGMQTPVPPDSGPGEEGLEGGDADEGALGDGPDAGTSFDPTTGERIRKYVVDDVPVKVVSQRVQYLDENGKLITASLVDYSRTRLRSTYQSLDHFLKEWNSADKKQAIIEELQTKGVFLDELAEQVGKDYDAFDLVCHVAFDQKPLTRRERVYRVKKRNVFGKYGDAARKVLEQLLDKYADTGITSVESIEILRIDPLTQFGTPVQIVSLFGGKPQYLQAVQELEDALYAEAA
jgi:type I restriction enzyme, R subunit